MSYEGRNRAESVINFCTALIFLEMFINTKRLIITAEISPADRSLWTTSGVTDAFSEDARV